MDGWILSIIGMVFLGVIFEIIVPEGKTNNFIKSIFTIIFMFVVISPILKLVKKQELIDFPSFFNYSQDEKTEQSLLELKIQIENYLATNGIEGVLIELSGYLSKNDLKIEKVYVDLSNSVIMEKYEHIDKYKLITMLIKEKVEIDEENVIYG